MLKVLFIVGPHASGKTFSTSQYIAENNMRDVLSIDTGPIMRDLHKQSCNTNPIDKWVLDLEKEFGNNITSVLITNEIKKRIVESKKEKVALIGIRTIDTIKFVISRLDITDFNILYVDADVNLLYCNYLKREKKDISFAEFIEYLDKEQKSGLSALKELAKQKKIGFNYFYKITNDDSFENVFLDCFDYNRNKDKVLKLKKEQKNGKL